MRLKDVNARPQSREKLGEMHSTFRRWLGDSYDLDAITAAASVAACQHLPGDTFWLMLISGSGFTKTETAQALVGAGGVLTSTVSSEGALLSASPKRERTDASTGGLLRTVGDNGLLILKDFTTILSMSRETRSSVLAALREVADGVWSRNVGSDGGQTLTWEGRCFLVAACTTSWDKHYSVISEMGDRFLILRMDSEDRRARYAAGASALRQTGSERQMRKELSDAAKIAIEHASAVPRELDDETEAFLLEIADFTTRARTAVEHDYRGDTAWRHAPEAPTRLAKYLWLMMRGAIALGATVDEARRLVQRIARDCIPPQRWLIVEWIARNPHTSARDVGRALDIPRSTADRICQELHSLRLLTLAPQETQSDKIWRYLLASNDDAETIETLRSTERAFPQPVGEVDPQDSTPRQDYGSEKSVHVERESDYDSEKSVPIEQELNFSSEKSIHVEREIRDALGVSDISEPKRRETHGCAGDDCMFPGCGGVS